MGQKTNVLATENFGALKDKEDLKKLQAVPFHARTPKTLLERKNQRNMERWITNHCVDKRNTY